MKKSFALFLLVTGLCAVHPVMAQKPGKLFSFGFGLEGAVPVGDLSSSFSGGGGVTGRFSLHAGPGFATFTTGAIALIPQNASTTNLKTGVQVPMKFGYKYVFFPHLFVMGELGYSSFRTYYEDQNNNVVTNTNGGFTYAPSVGFQWGMLELAARYESIQVSGGNISFMGFRAGLNF